MKGRGLRSRIHVRAARGHPLSKAKAAANRAKSRIRARIEHVFGAQETAPGTESSAAAENKRRADAASSASAERVKKS